MIAALFEYYLNNYDKGFEDLYHPGLHLYNSFEPSIPRHNVQKALSSLVSKGFLERKEEDGYYRLTNVGWAEVGQLQPLGEAQRRKWDGLWRIVIYDVPEKKSVERNYLRRHLKEIGFRLWQKSTWITPLPVRKELYNLLKEKKLTGRISVFESRNLFGLGNRDLAKKVWNLNTIQSGYINLIKEWELGKKKVGRDPRKLKELAGKCQQRYLESAQKDPHLPIDLLPKDWPVKQLRSFLSEISLSLS